MHTFNEACDYLGKLPDGFNAHDPVYYHEELEAAFADGSIAGKKFIGPLELLNGKDAKGKPILKENLVALKNKGGLQGPGYY